MARVSVSQGSRGRRDLPPATTTFVVLTVVAGVLQLTVPGYVKALERPRRDRPTGSARPAGRPPGRLVSRGGAVRLRHRIAISGNSGVRWVAAALLIAAGSLVYQVLRGRGRRRADVVLAVLILAAAFAMTALANHHGPAILAGALVTLAVPGTRGMVMSTEESGAPGGSS
jgi:hypothetical protein